MDLKDMRNAESAELQERERQLKQELFNLRFQLATGRIENPVRIRQTRRELARLKTVLHERTTNKAATAEKP